MKNRLFLIEGIPCTGKTSTAKFLADLMSKIGEKVLYFPEGTADHPADYDFHAFLTPQDLIEFSEAEKQIVLNCSQCKNSGYIVPLNNMHGELFDKVIKYKIYDMLPWEKEYPVMLNKWQEFSKIAKSNDYIYVFDCCFLQNPLCETMMRFNMKQEETSSYINNIYNYIKPLNPVVVYLKNTEIKNRIQEISKERDSRWLDDVIEYHTSQGYGKACGYKGFNGYIECLKERQKRELSILNNLGIEKIIIDNPFVNWEETHTKLEEIKGQL